MPRRADLPHATNEGDFKRIARAVKRVEGQFQNDPYQAKRWYGSEGGEGLPLRYGLLRQDLAACSVNGEWVSEFTETSGSLPVPVIKPDGTQSTFYVVERHGTALKAGQWVTAGYSGYGDTWIAIAAHCTGSCLGNTTCTGTPPNCLAGEEAVCVNGQWQCQPIAPIAP